MSQYRYDEFLLRKSAISVPTGISHPGDVSEKLFSYQQQIVRWALRRGRAAIWADCGLGKTPMQLEWARHVMIHTGKPVLILAPLAVASQTVREGAKFEIEVSESVGDDTVGRSGIYVTNYEKLHRFDAAAFGGVVLDESSILKNYAGKYRNDLIESFAATPFRLACTATPAPNDHMELANHAEFLGAMKRAEMLSMFFVHDGGSTASWRLKGHAEETFWSWVASWAVMLRRPSDLGFSDDGFTLPELTVHQHVTQSDASIPGQLFVTDARTLSERRAARKASIRARCERVASIVNHSGGSWVIWCGLNAESELVTSLVHGAVEVTGSMSDEQKRDALVGFSMDEFSVLVTKPRIGGFGLNWQHCHQIAFVGLSDSYEQYYQAVRRCWRFGQLQAVHVHIVIDEREGDVIRNVQRKESDAVAMAESMVAAMRETSIEQIGCIERKRDIYRRDTASGDGWTVHLGDCVDVIKEIDAKSVDYSIFSPPFASLYTYSASDRDMGNASGMDEFSDHFGFLVDELLRVMRPGRLLSFHCMQLPASKTHDGFIGLKDFRGQLISAFVERGWIYHSEVVIWKDPVTAMQRTKALGLLWKQLRKDSAMSRQGIPDYLVTMRAPGENTKRICHTKDDYPVEKWQRVASPVWMDVNPSRTLQRESAREERDEKHICPLQLDVIERALELWTATGDLVLSPFAGIGSEGYQALKMGRRFVGVELKESYWRQAVENLRMARAEEKQTSLFDRLGLVS